MYEEEWMWCINYMFWICLICLIYMWLTYQCLSNCPHNYVISNIWSNLIKRNFLYTYFPPMTMSPLQHHPDGTFLFTVLSQFIQPDQLPPGGSFWLVLVMAWPTFGSNNITLRSGNIFSPWSDFCFVEKCCPFQPGVNQINIPLKQSLVIWFTPHWNGRHWTTNRTTPNTLAKVVN